MPEEWIHTIKGGYTLKTSIDAIIETDVLVVGGGGAGASAAVAAARGGAKVLLVSKGQAGNSGNTIMIGGSYAMDGHSAYYEYGIKNADPTLTKDILYESIVKDGFYLNDQNMVNQFVEESPAIVYEIKEWAEKAGKPFVFHKPATWWMSGNMMGSALKYGLRNTGGIEVMEDIIIVDLLKKGDAVSGAIGINIMTGELLQFNARSVVLGTGGFQPFSFKNTNSDMTGDGPAMAFRAGAKLADMEFLLFLMTALEPKNITGSILPLMVATNPNFKYRAVDKNGKELNVPPKLKDIETKSELCKLIHIVYYGKAITSGEGTEKGGVYLDVLNTDEELDQVFDETVEMFEGFYKKGFYHGDDINQVREMVKRTRKWEIGLGNEYSVGGILVNEKMETGVKGLYAGGECASGVFGANRVADAVTEMLVQGYRAGTSAAEYAKKAESCNPENMEEIVSRLLSVFDNGEGITVTEAVKKLETISDKGLNCYRTGEGLEEAVDEYVKLERLLDKISLKNKSRAYNYEWIQYIQLKNRLTCSKVAAMMGSMRKESRGLHLRLDYPEIDNENWLVRIIAENKDGEVVLSTRKPVEGKVSLPEPSKIGYETYLLENDLGLENLQ